MPRRYWSYPPEWQVLNVLSSAGATVLAVGYILPLFYLLWSLKYGERAGSNPWHATGLEWQTTSPPPKYNFAETPIVTQEAYNYDTLDSESKGPLPRDERHSDTDFSPQNDPSPAPKQERS